MSFDAQRLYELLPAVYRVRDAAHGEPLKALVAVIAEQVAVIEEDLDQLYDDHFIETCAEWAIPYIGDLVGARGVYSFPNAPFSARAQVANTLAYRRRKGTATVLEQLARDVTGWNASVVEYFQRLATTQYMNHVRPKNLSFASLRDSVTIVYPPNPGTHQTSKRTEPQANWEALERLTSPFDQTARTADVRHIDNRRGKHNIPNIGIFLWRLESFQITETSARRVDGRRFCFDPLCRDIPLFNRPQSEDKISHLAEPVNVPMPLSRRVLHENLGVYYGHEKSVYVRVQYITPSSPLATDEVDACDLSDLVDSNGAVLGWAHMPTDKIAIDPVLGRIALPVAATEVRVNYHYGFSAKMGGGEYGRATTFSSIEPVVRVPSDHTTIQAALDSLASTGGVVEIEDSGHYFETPTLRIPSQSKIELRGGDEQRPVIFANGDITVLGEEDAEATFNGLLIAGGNVSVPREDAFGSVNLLRRLEIVHCTLSPATDLKTELSSPPVVSPPDQSQPVRLLIEREGTDARIASSIVGPLRIIEGGEVGIDNSIIDAGDSTAIAYAGIDPLAHGAALRIRNSTVIGRVHTSIMVLASNTIFHSESSSAQPAVHATRLQEGCVRFSFVPTGSQVPRKYKCQPNEKSPTNPGDSPRGIAPVFTSLRFGDPGYAQLSQFAAVEILQGGDDEAEMGAFHDLYQPQREANLRERLDEYLRFGLEAGIFNAT